MIVKEVDPHRAGFVLTQKFYPPSLHHSRPIFFNALIFGGFPRGRDDCLGPDSVEKFR